jgi:lipopolysaccharide transport system ATP-binding protein
MLNGDSLSAAKLKANDIEEFTEIGKFFEQPVRTYSSGMKSRLGFATGILTHVDILLIDETLSVGDHSFKAKAEQAIKDKMSGKQTAIHVSHSETQLSELCQRGII